MKRNLISLAIVIFVLTACASGPDEPVNNNDSPTSQTNDYIPKTEDANLIRDVVYLDSVDLLTLESFPLQFTLVLNGNLPTPCHQLRISVEQPDTENKIVIDAYSVADPNTACVQVLEPLEVNFPLGSFPEGKYTLWINGELTAEFEL